MKHRKLCLPIAFAQQANVQSGPLQLVTQHGGWQARVRKVKGSFLVSRVHVALSSELQRSACPTISFTLLRPGRVLISTEGEAQHSAVVADVARAAAERAARAEAERAA